MTRPSRTTIAKRLHKRSREERQTCPWNAVSMPSLTSSFLPHQHLAIFKRRSPSGLPLTSRLVFRPLRGWGADRAGSIMPKCNVVWRRPVASPRIRWRSGRATYSINDLALCLRTYFCVLYKRNICVSYPFTRGVPFALLTWTHCIPFIHTSTEQLTTNEGLNSFKCTCFSVGRRSAHSLFISIFEYHVPLASYL